MRMRVQPFHQLLVQSRTGLLGHRLVGGVAYEQVTKPESVVAGNLGPVGADQLLADESEEMRSDAGTDRLGALLALHTAQGLTDEARAVSHGQRRAQQRGGMQRAASPSRSKVEQIGPRRA